MKTEEEEGASCSPPPISSGPSIHPKTDLPVDTVTDSTKTRFYKVTKTPALTSLITQKYKELAAFHDLSSQFSMNEVYPEFVLVYRKKTGGKDTRFLFKSIIIWIYSLRKNGKVWIYSGQAGYW